MHMSPDFMAAVTICSDFGAPLWRKLSAEELMLLNCGVGEDSWESLGLQGDPTSPSKGDQPWVFFGRNDTKAETPVLWPPHVKSWLIGKDSDVGMDWGQEEKGTTEDEMAGWHHQLNGCEFEWTPGDGDGQGGLGCCDSWGRKESDMTEQLNWTELNLEFIMSFGQINVNRHDKTRGLQCAYMTKISFLHSRFSHQKNMPQVYWFLW